MQFSYEVIYGKRKNITLSVRENGRVIIRAPKRAGRAEIDRLVKAKQEWISRHVQRSVERYGSAKKKFCEGEMFLFLGKEYPLRLIPDYRSRLHFDGAFLLSAHKTAQAGSLFEDWYKEHAKTEISTRVGHYAKMLEVSPARISINGAATRWGSCSSLKSINFSWKLIMAPPEVVDYVVVHELTHLIHHNHSKRFWEAVARHYPDYQKARRWLKANGHALRLVR